MGNRMKDPKVAALITKVKDLFNEIETVNRELIKHDVRYTAKIDPSLTLTVSEFRQMVEY